jgi:uncharacterized protein (TIGR03437 family)
MRFLIALAFAAPLFAQPLCTYVVDPPSFSISAASTPGTVHVTQTPGSACGNFSATTQTPWLHLTSGSVGTPGGPGVTFTADANPLPTQRSGLMVIALTNVVVTQAGRTDCVFGLTPTSQNIPVGGGDAVFNVQANCPWQTTSNSAWITFAGVGNGISDSRVGYSVAANTCVAGRGGAITLRTSLANPPTLAVTQDGSPGNLSLSAYTATVGSASTDGRIDLRTGDVCSWSASSDVSWIRITVGSSGTGNGGISYHLLENTAAQRTGSIHVGALTYTITQLAPAPPPVVLSAVTNAASYSIDAVSPGEIVALFGANMGPASIVIPEVSNGTFPNSLAGTQVLFDGVAAPMIYTRKDQVSAVVPYGVAGKTSTQVQVQYQGVLSNTLTAPVRATTPAIFSLDSTGVGPGAILNQDTSINSTGNPAARLSVISIYSTGAGITTPASADGELIGAPLRFLAQTTVVTIGGVNAVVKYAGAAPGAVAGLTQINVEVPAGISSALALPVIVRIGDFTSTSSMTVAVK